MKKILIALLVTVPTLANAGSDCIGTGSYKTCYDDYGNTYDISRYGNTTEVQGRNSRTGARWSQESTTYGNVTEVTGKDKDGNRWNETIIDNGNYIDYSGRDSNGKRFYKTCRKTYNGELDCF